MRKLFIFSFIIAAMLLMSGRAFAYDFYTVFDGDTIYYNITNNTDAPYTVEVTHYTVHNNPTTYQGSVAIPSTVTYNGETYIVTSIGESAFNGSQYLISVSIPNTVTRIGMDGFMNCPRLTSITIPNSVTFIDAFAFSGCTSLALANISNNVTEIGYMAFANTALDSITLPNSLKILGQLVFADCHSLLAINVGNGNPVFASIDGVLFNHALDTLICFPGGRSGHYTIPNSVECIGIQAFYHCYLLTSITIPNSVVFIEANAFEDCTGLTSVTIPSSVISIYYNPFNGCTGLTDTSFTSNSQHYTVLNGVLFNSTQTILISYPAGKTGSYTIPNTVTKIAPFAFDSCPGLTSVTIPNSVTMWGYNSFSRCIGLTTITIPNSLTYVPSSAFWHCTNLVSATLPNTITDIYALAFDHCTSLSSINIPNSVTNLDIQVFSFCTSLNSITIPGSVSSLPRNLFLNCTNLRKVIIEDSISTIDNGAFYYCSALDTIVFKQDNPPTIIENGFTFYNVPSSATIIVPCNRSQAYRDAMRQWFYHFVEDCSPVSIAETESHNPVLLYPNPASSTVTIEGLEENSSIQIVNTLGGVVKRIENIGQKTTISVGDLPKGLYFVRTNGTMRKLVVE